MIRRHTTVLNKIPVTSGQGQYTIIIKLLDQYPFLAFLIIVDSHSALLSGKHCRYCTGICIYGVKNIQGLTRFGEF